MPDASTIWVVFSGETEIRWLRLCLKPGFRHCYVLINDGGGWITYDPLAHKTEIAVHRNTKSGFDLPGWLKGRGLHVVQVNLNEPPKKRLQPAVYTCVEAVKRVIGLRNWFILTPYQLYKSLIKQQLKERQHGIHDITA